MDRNRFLQTVSGHLDMLVGVLKYPHATSQKEEIVDKEYLAQRMKDHGRKSPQE